jgi:hypothetical protein
MTHTGCDDVSFANDRFGDLILANAWKTIETVSDHVVFLPWFAHMIQHGRRDWLIRIRPWTQLEYQESPYLSIVCQEECVTVAIQREDLWLLQHLIVDRKFHVTNQHVTITMKLANVPMMLLFHDHWKPISTWNIILEELLDNTPMCLSVLQTLYQYGYSFKSDGPRLLYNSLCLDQTFYVMNVTQWMLETVKVSWIRQSDGFSFAKHLLMKCPDTMTLSYLMRFAPTEFIIDYEVLCILTRKSPEFLTDIIQQCPYPWSLTNGRRTTPEEWKYLDSCVSRTTFYTEEESRDLIPICIKANMKALHIYPLLINGCPFEGHEDALILHCPHDDALHAWLRTKRKNPIKTFPQ